jgi:hypothetical protein
MIEAICFDLGDTVAAEETTVHEIAPAKPLLPESLKAHSKSWKLLEKRDTGLP